MTKLIDNQSQRTRGDTPMMEQELCYNINNQNWDIVDDRLVKGKEIEDIPVVVVMTYDSENYIWCKHHKQFEQVQECVGIKWRTNFCIIDGIPVCFSYKNPNSHAPCNFNGFSRYYYKQYIILKIPVRWRMNIHDDKNLLFIGVDICELLIGHSDAPPVYASPRIRKYVYGITTYDIQSENIYHFQKKLAYPVTVTEKTIDMLRDLAKVMYGLKPAKVNCITVNENYIKAFLFRPYDLNCYFLQKYVNMEYIPKDCKNAYHIICEQLETNPPKGLKKLYHYNPYVVPMYRVLCELGFKDYNLMRLFFDDYKIGDVDFSQCGKCDFPFWDTGGIKYNKQNKPSQIDRRQNNDMISQDEIDYLLSSLDEEKLLRQYNEYRAWNKLKFIVNWFMQNKSELNVARKLYKYTKESDIRWKNDVYNMLYQYFDDLSDTVKNEFLSHGCTVAVHDKLVFEINHLEYVRQEIKYRPYEEELQCEINGFRFELPRYTDEFADIGREMSNCLASYIQSVLNHNCTIVVVKKDNHCLACIEVNEEGRDIIQALGFNNKNLEGDIKDIVIMWSKKMMLFDSMIELNVDEFKWPNNQPIEYKNLDNKKTYFIYTIKELVNLPKEDRGEGFYRTLTTKVVTRYFYIGHRTHFTLPGLDEIPNRDERVYIHKIFPDLDCVLEDALDGVAEAQSVMYELYKHYLPFNYAKTNFWDMKSKFVRYSFPPLRRSSFDDDDLCV